MGKLAEIKTKETNASVEDFINTLESQEKRNDSFLLLKLMEKITKEKPKMWGGSLIGFGNKRFKSPASGREVDWFKVGFSPRKANLTLYLMLDHKQIDAQLKQLGKYKTGGGCLYINKLKDIDVKILQEIIGVAFKANK